MCPIDPPISEAQLVELGLNRVDKVPLPTSSNTVRSKKFKTRDNIFKTNWQQVSVKPASNAESSVTYEKYVPKKIQYEQKRDSYHQDPTQCRIEDHFYNRDFLLLMRDLVRV
jgi:hypothetical protein